MLHGKRTSPANGFNWNVRSGLPKRIRITAPPGYRDGRYTGWGDLTDDVKANIRERLPSINVNMLDIARTGLPITNEATTHLAFLKRLLNLCALLMQLENLQDNVILVNGAEGEGVRVEIAYCRYNDWRPYHYRVLVHGVLGFPRRMDRLDAPSEVAEYLLPLANRLKQMHMTHTPLTYAAPSWTLKYEELIV